MPWPRPRTILSDRGRVSHGKAGIDPLTVDQHFMHEQISEEYEQPIYRYLMAHSPVSQPTIFVDADDHPWALLEVQDATSRTL
jgi:hypothetical protein